jgi:hypothetical protein
VTTTAPVALPFRVGARTLGRVERRLLRQACSLEEVIAGQPPTLPPLARDAHGYWLRSLPEAALPALLASQRGLVPFIRQRYRRHFTDLTLSFDAYLDAFSGKTRSTLRRKRRKLEERSGGALEIRRYRTPDEMVMFHTLARAVSAASYQERLLDAGLPQGPEALRDMRALAERDQARAWLLFLDCRPISYLYAPAEGDTLIYAYLGYNPAHAAISPGTVLQLEVMRDLMEEGRFRRFDFTEGEGQHKSLFATGSVPCADLMLLRRSPGNVAVGLALNGFDRSVAVAKAVATRAGVARAARTALR